MKITHTHFHKSLYHSLLVAALLALFASGNVQAEILQHKNQQPAISVVSADRKLTFDELMEQLKDKRAVFVAEKHDRYDHHLNQLTILRAMHTQNPQLAIGVEWFQQSFQSVVDDYLAGKITEADLLRQTEYYQRWRYDFRMLRPVMEFAKANKLPVIALNAPTEITSKISKGGLKALTKKEKQQVPATINPPPAKYQSYLEGIFNDHMGGHGDLKNFILVQRTWDETMAMNTANYLTANPQHRMVVFAGSGHLGRGAIPSDVARTIPAKLLSTIHSAEAEGIEPDSFDYFILSTEQTLPPTGKLGAWLDDKNQQISILKLAENSAAGDAGLEAGDILITVNEQAINTMADIFMLLSKHQPGDNVDVLVERDKQQIKYVFPLK